MKIKHCLIALSLLLLTGCGTTFEQRVPYYKAGFSFGVEALKNGDATNMVNTAKGLIGR